MEYVTIYDFSKETPSYSVLLFPLIFIIIGLFIFFIAYNSTPDLDKPVNSFDPRKRKLLIGGIFVILSLSVIFRIAVFKNSTNSELSQALAENKIKIVEGKVENYHPMPKEGHDQEKFDVNGVHFEFADNPFTDEGYDNAACNGGVIRQGLYVRINYYERPKNTFPQNVISKLEIAE